MGFQWCFVVFIAVVENAKIDRFRSRWHHPEGDPIIFDRIPFFLFLQNSVNCRIVLRWRGATVKFTSTNYPLSHSCVAVSIFTCQGFSFDGYYH